MSEPPPQVSAGGRVVGWLLLVVGGLMALLCGACTLTMLVVGLGGANAGSGGGGGAVMAVMGLVIGGVPTVGGAALVWVGWRILHPAPTPTARSVAKTFE